MAACKQTDIAPADYHSATETWTELEVSNEKKTTQAKTKSHYKVEVEKIPIKGGNSLQNIAGTTSRKREETCYDVWQVYIDVNSGDIVGRDYRGMECSGGGDDGGSGGGGDNGGSSGGGSSYSGDADGSHTFLSGVYDAEAVVQQQQPTLGNYAATLLISPRFYQVINVRVEIDLNAKDIKKITITMNGVTWLTKYTQVGDGIMTGYDPSTDTYSFKVATMKELGGVWTEHNEIFGTISPRNGYGTLTIP